MIEDAVKLVEENAGRVVADIERVTVTALLIFAAAPERTKQLVADYIPIYKNYVHSLSELIGDEKSTSANIIVAEIVVIVVVVNVVARMHQILFAAMHKALPVIYLRSYHANRFVDNTNRLIELTYKFYKDSMDRDDFDRLFDAYEFKAEREIAQISKSGNPRRIFIKEQLFIFVLVAGIFGDVQAHYLLYFFVVAALLVWGFVLESESVERDSSKFDITKRAALDLLSSKLSANIAGVAIDTKVSVKSGRMTELRVGPLQYQKMGKETALRVFGNEVRWPFRREVDSQ